MRRTLPARVALAALVASLAPFAAPLPAGATDLPCPPSPNPPVALTGTPPTLRELATPRGLRIGSALAPTSLRNTQYRDTAAREFSVLTPENQLKWATVHPRRAVYDFCAADQLASFAAAHGMAMRGHTLAWHNQNPAWLTDTAFSRDEMIAILHDHIATVVGHYKTAFPGLVTQWDVVNEAITDCGGTAPCPLRSTVWSQRIGPDYLDYAFRFAREADPAARLFYNDYSIERPGAKLDGVLAQVDAMRARGVPVDGVGFQFHIGAYGAPSAADIAATMGAVSSRGLDVAVTELDVGVGITGTNATASPNQLGTQAAVYRRVLDGCLANARCHTFVVWGFTDAQTWRSPDQPCLFDKQYVPKVAYDALRDRLLDGTDERAGEVVVRQAEDMTQYGGGSVADGWSLRATGDAVASDVALAGSAAYVVSVIARGTLAGSAWPLLEVRVDNALVGTVEVNAMAWAPYEVAFSAPAGVHRVTATFANDYYAPPEDRNVDVDAVTVATAAVEAEAMHARSTGSPVAGGWALYQNGTVSNAWTLSATGRYDVRVVARGTPSGGTWPQVEVRMDGAPVGRATVASADWSTVVLTVPFSAGPHTVALAFVNDANTPQDRNLFLDRLTIVSASGVR
jgi:endo-1,4-beta-xylanase